MTTLYGDPTASGPFAVRIQFPSGYEIPIGSRPTDGYITVISGKMRLAWGDRLDGPSTQSLVPKAFVRLRASAPYRLRADADSVVELHSSGPFDMKLAA
jgi:hypothetical protein